MRGTTWDFVYRVLIVSLSSSLSSHVVRRDYALHSMNFSPAHCRFKMWKFWDVSATNSSPYFPKSLKTFTSWNVSLPEKTSLSSVAPQKFNFNFIPSLFYSDILSVHSCAQVDAVLHIFRLLCSYESCTRVCLLSCESSWIICIFILRRCGLVIEHQIWR